jgi:hypothetical protein
VVYESSAISQLSNAQGRWGNLRVYYPKLTLWSDHPIALLNAPWVTDAQRSAARQLSAFLRSKPVQERALRFGFRPAETSVPLKAADPQNPFTRLAEFGVQTSVPSVAEPPDAPVIRNLLGAVDSDSSTALEPIRPTSATHAGLAVRARLPRLCRNVSPPARSASQ